MDKETFSEILEVSLLAFDGMTQKEIMENWDVSLEVIKIGMSLGNYLKSKEVSK